MSKEPDQPIEPPNDVSRREFLGTAGAALALTTAAGSSTLEAQSPRLDGGAVSRPRTRIRVTINGKDRQIQVDDHWTLAEMLRDHLRLTGTKLGCERGECGACTVLVDEKPVYSCSSLAVWADGQSVTTVEGLAKNGKLDSLQEAFIAHDAAQCGFCTSGQLMAAKALLNANPSPTIAEVRAALAGNICRCANYVRIAEAVLAARTASTLRRTSGGAQ